MAKAKKDNDVFEEGDDSLVFDMEAVEEAVNELVPQGKYQCTIEEVEFKFSQSSNKPMWSLTLVIVEGEYRGRKLFTNMSFSEKALPITKGQIMEIAPEIVSNRFDPKGLAEEGALVGKQLTAKVKHETYEGEKRARVGTLSKPAGGGDDFLD